MAPLLFALLLMCTTASTAAEYTGNNLVTVLGESPKSETFNRFKTFWLLDDNLANPDGGIRLYTDRVGSRIDTVLLSGYGYQCCGVNFRSCSSALPFGISLTDNVEGIKQKLNSDMVKRGDDYFFNGPGVVVKVRYQSYGKIQSLRIYKGSVVTLSEPIKPVSNSTTVSTTSTTTTTRTATVSSTGHTPLHRACMQVFNSWQKSSFADLKATERNTTNFWNYKYTYSTRVKIPGEKFNMVYSFPFVTSSLDFVSVLKEADTYDNSFQEIYKQFEKDLSSSFTKADGWEGRCLPNTDGSKLSDLEYRHPKYGSVVLDYSRNPKGKHVLYLRFVPFS